MATLRRKKHRLVIEMTTSAAISESEAVRGLQALLDARIGAETILWAAANRPLVGNLTIKSFSRVREGIERTTKRRAENIPGVSPERAALLRERGRAVNQPKPEPTPADAALVAECKAAFTQHRENSRFRQLLHGGGYAQGYYLKPFDFREPMPPVMQNETVTMFNYRAERSFDGAVQITGYLGDRRICVVSEWSMEWAR